jgi:hypothetical protein
MFYRVGVHIFTQNGKFFRVTDPIESTSVPPIVFEENFLTYPDRQVKEFVIYGRAGTSGDWSYKTFEATPSLSANLSYADIGGGLSLTDLNQGTISDADLVNTPQLNERDANRVLVSDLYAVRRYLGRKAQVVGDGASDGVLLFASNAQPISTGQFGQYPAFAFCQRSRFAMEVGAGGIAFQRVSPDELNRGVIGRNAAVNIGKRIVFIASDGVWVLPGHEHISLPIQDSPFTDDLLKNVNEQTSLAYYRDDIREEVWISGTTRVYAFSLKHGCWFTIGIIRRRFVSIMGRTIGIGTDGNLWEESGVQLAFQVET